LGRRHNDFRLSLEVPPVKLRAEGHIWLRLYSEWQCNIRNCYPSHSRTFSKREARYTIPSFYSHLALHSVEHISKWHHRLHQPMSSTLSRFDSTNRLYSTVTHHLLFRKDLCPQRHHSSGSNKTATMAVSALTPPKLRRSASTSRSDKGVRRRSASPRPRSNSIHP
jgi:hypothetical protein